MPVHNLQNPFKHAANNRAPYSHNNLPTSYFACSYDTATHDHGNLGPGTRVPVWQRVPVINMPGNTSGHLLLNERSSLISTTLQPKNHIIIYMHTYSFGIVDYNVTKLV